MKEQPYAITISHQLGCGGSYIGKKLSEEFNIPFVDRDILKQVANKLNVAEEDLEHRDERLSSFWEEFTRLQLYTEPLAGGELQYYPSDKELFFLESEYITRIVKESPAIILGRGGRYVLREHPRHVSIFIMADLSERIKRVATIFQISEEDAKIKIQANDKERAAFNRAFTKTDGLDVRLYDLSINTSTVGLNLAAQVAIQCIRSKLDI
ncbi:MAG: cytidylate kinase-like family protein [Ethanoligenens sp.]